ncbi:hypothetical protein ENH_00009170 [Eimeria necatrix]|uniref:Integrase catalytic domain-containing protein n=1 Tax=Eimeria necatrix TaxID=51315 RepID=U6MGQ4_9EIME|nr:hypothetical protein ENH_00009170 [Eimeria necatrix]CDJ62243.1 hypothetical protein ENH_00009170 [Eimeria necatrix]
MMCAVETGPNAIPVSLELGNQLLRTAGGAYKSDERAEGTQSFSETRRESGSTSILSEETPDATLNSSRKSAEVTDDGHRSDATEIVPHWWRETCTKESYDQGGALCCAGATAVLRVELAGSPCETLLDTGASRSFISPKIVERLQLKVRRLPKEHRFTVDTGAQLRIDRVVTGLTLWCGHTRFSEDVLVGPVPYDLVLGLDWLTEHKVAWYFQSDKLRTYVNGQWCELPVVRTGETTLQRDTATVVHPRTPAEQAYEILAKQVAGMSAEEAAAYLRPPPRRYKSHAKTKAKARITSLVRQAADDTNDISTPLQGSKPTSSGCRSLLASTASVAAESDEESPWPTAKLEHTLFDEWINLTEAQDIPCEVAQVLHEYRAVFPDTLPKDLPPKRPHDHHILLVPGKLPARSAIYRMTPDQLTFHKQEIAKLSDSGWIGPTYSPICSPTIMVDKRDDGSGERKMRMVVNYQALNALSIAPDFPLPPIQTILELLGGVKYFSTLDLGAGFHQVRMAKEDRWKTAFRSVLGLFEYRVMPFGLKGVSFKWTELHTQAVRQLKQRLIDFTILQVPDTTKPFELYTDASGYAIGAVLEQDGKPIGFLSQVMSPTRQRYSIYDHELLALVTALDKWSHLLRVSKGARNQVADALSRRPGLPTTCSHDTPSVPLMLATGQASANPRSRGPPPNYRELAGIRPRRPRRRSTPSAPSPAPPEPNPEPEPSTLTTKAPADPPDVRHWPQAYSKCPVFRVPYKAAANRPGKALQIEFCHRQSTFRYVEPYLHTRVHGLWRICVPQFREFLTHALHSHHDHVIAGHRGQKKTFAALSKHYYWPGTRAYTTAYIESCTHCRVSKSINQKPAGLLQQLLISSRQWTHVSLDFITDLPLTTTGHDSILFMVDSLSKMAHFVPAKKSFTAADTVELLADRLMRYHGFPEVLISDRVPRFQSDLWNQLCRRFNIKRCMFSPYHPQSDGQTEQVNRTLEQMLRTYIKTDERALAPTLTPPMTKLFRQLCDRAQSHILKAKWQQKYYADTKRRAVEYAVGDKVWLTSNHLPPFNSYPKFESRYRGPFEFIERIGTVAYRLALPPTYECHNVFHVSQLVPHRPRPPALVPSASDAAWPPIRNAAGSPTEEYEVDYIMDERGSGGAAQYLVKSRGTLEDQATWKPANHLPGCPALLRAWRRRQ